MSSDGGIVEVCVLLGVLCDSSVLACAASEFSCWVLGIGGMLEDEDSCPVGCVMASCVGSSHISRFASSCDSSWNSPSESSGVVCGNVCVLPSDIG